MILAATLYKAVILLLFIHGLVFFNVSYSKKPVLNGHSKIDKTNVLKTDGSLMQVKSIVECSLAAFSNILGMH